MPRLTIVCILLIQLFLSCGNSTAGNEPAEVEVATVAGTDAAGPQAFSSFDGANISYIDVGVGEPVILIHGFINTSKSWEGSALYKELRQQGYRVIIPDLRGNGGSDKPQTDEAYANDAEVKDLKALADHLALETFAVVGYSRGSIVLAKWLTQEPRIHRAVIGGMGFDFTKPEWERRLLFAAAFGGKAELTDDTRGAVEYATSIGADLRSLHLQQKHQPVTSPDALRQVSIPIMVLVGDKDKDNGNPGNLERLFPNGKLNIVPGDHNTTYRSVVFGAAAMAFIKSK